jgi:hypothetical protein
MLKAFIDPSLGSYAAIKDVNAPSLFVPLGADEGLMLIGGSEHKYAVFLAGKFAGQTRRIGDTDDWAGMAISGIQIEADASTAFAPDGQGKRELALVRRGDMTGVFATFKNGSFPQNITVEISGEEPQTGMRLGFMRWRIVVPAYEGPRELLVVEAKTGQ